MDDNQLSLFKLSHEPVPTPVPSTSEESYSFLHKYWSNSDDLAFCMVNVLLCTNELLFEFVEYIKTYRLSEVADEVQRPSSHRRFDHLAECLKRLEFTLVERGDNGEVIPMEMTVLTKMKLTARASITRREARRLFAWCIIEQNFYFQQEIISIL